MKTFLLPLLILAASCTNKSDNDLQDGTYETRSPISIDGKLINDKWIIEGDRFTITRNDQIIYTIVGIHSGKRVDLFPLDNNPYYPHSFAKGLIITVSWGFYFYPTTGETFTLQKQF